MLLKFHLIHLLFHINLEIIYLICTHSMNNMNDANTKIINTFFIRFFFILLHSANVIFLGNKKIN